MLFLPKRRTYGWMLCGLLLSLTIRAIAGTANANTLSLAELQQIATGQGLAVRTFHLEGVVCATVAERKMVALQDDSATVLLELPDFEGTPAPGDRLTIEADQCTVVRDRFGIRLGAEVINNDGTHNPVIRTGKIFLEAGRQPIRLEWFNAAGESALNVQYEGPGVTHQRIPATALCWQRPSQTNFEPGLHFAAYIQKDVQVGPDVQLPNRPYDGWAALPDFAQLKVESEGVATNFDNRYRTRDEYAALVFYGYLQIQTSGIYTFSLESDDGSRLYVGNPSARCKVIVSHDRAVPVTRLWQQTTTGASKWSELIGTMVFAARNDGETELEVSSGNGLAELRVLGKPAEISSGLLHRQIEVSGIAGTAPDGTALMIVPGWDQIKIFSSTNNAVALSSARAVLTSAGQIRQLKPEQARGGISTKLEGVVISASVDSLVLQDTSGGVFVHWYSDSLANHPRVGELWRVEGRTDAGDFSPVVFASNVTFVARVAMPDPVRPTWDQLMNGSLDAEYVEVRGVITAASDTGITLLTPDGETTVEGNKERPLPHFTSLMLSDHPLVGSLVRMRGCFTADWDWQTRQVKGGKFNLCPAVVEVEEAASTDPFSLPATKSEDLLRFNARAGALQRTKVTGQIVHVRPDEYFMLDGQTGVRLLTKSPHPLRPGDLIEAVGFPKLGGPSPVLQDAEIKVAGRAALPQPVQISETNLLDANHDSTWVRIEALLISETVRQDERELELQNESQHFAAILKSDPRTWTTYAPGTRLRLTGVYASEDRENHGAAVYPFEILLNNAAGIEVLKRPSWWTVRHAVIIAAALGAALAIAFIWITLLHRKVEQRTVQLQKEIEARQLVEQHRIMEQERARVARDLHDELGTGLTEVSMLGELGTNPAVTLEEKERCFQQITASARALVTGLDEIVWAINPGYDSVSSVATYYSFFADRFLRLAGITCRLHVPAHLPECPLASNVRHGVFLACKEALNNIVRHSGASEVEFKVEVVEDALFIVIRDNGKGILSDGLAPGNDGLSGMRKRLHEFGGTCRIVGNNPGKGTTVEFRLPLRPFFQTRSGGVSVD